MEISNKNLLRPDKEADGQYAGTYIVKERTNVTSVPLRKEIE